MLLDLIYCYHSLEFIYTLGEVITGTSTGERVRFEIFFQNLNRFVFGSYCIRVV
jgi:hypothetical protein